MFPVSVQFSSVQLLSRVQLFATPWTAACQASLSIINSQSLWVCVSCSVMSDSWDPMDYSPPGSFLYEILQTRVLGWVAISFYIQLSVCVCVCVCVCVYVSCSVMSDFANAGMVAHQAPFSMRVSRQEYWGGLPFPSTYNWVCVCVCVC